MSLAKGENHKSDVIEILNFLCVMRLDVNIWTVIPELTLTLSYFFSREKKFSSSKSTAVTFIIKFIFIICHMGCISTFKCDTKSNAIQNDLHFTEIHSHRVKWGISSVHRWWLIKIHVFFQYFEKEWEDHGFKSWFPEKYGYKFNSVRYFSIETYKLCFEFIKYRSFAA